jgi:hypothetical protein
MQFRARSLRIALFASALMTAVAVPAAAAPAAPADSTATHKAVGTAQQRRQINVTYNLRPAAPLGAGMSSQALGRLLWTGSSVRHTGLIRDRGLGSSFVTFRLQGPRSEVRTFRVLEGARSTNFAMTGRFNRIEVRECKLIGRARICSRPRIVTSTWR